MRQNTSYGSVAVVASEYIKTYLQSIGLLLEQLVTSNGSLQLTLEDLLVHTRGRYFRHGGAWFVRTLSGRRWELLSSCCWSSSLAALEIPPPKSRTDPFNRFWRSGTREAGLKRFCTVRGFSLADLRHPGVTLTLSVLYPGEIRQSLSPQTAEEHHGRRLRLLSRYPAPNSRCKSTKRKMLLTLSKTANRWLGKFLLKQGIKARFALCQNGVMRDNPTLDSMLLLPLAMKLVSLEVHDTSQNVIKEALASESANSSSQQHTTESLGKLRIQILERFVRPALVPNEQWNDVLRWRFHQRLVKWLRKEFLLAKYSDHLRAGMAAYPSMRQSPQLSSRKRNAPPFSMFLSSSKLPFDKKDTPSDSALLPTSQILLDALDMRDWTSKKNHAATGNEMSRISQQLGGQMMEFYGGALRFADVPPSTDVSQLSLQELLQVAGSHVSLCGPLNALCEHFDIYQVWTREYIDALGTYLLKRTSDFSGETVILEVGAGDGLLSAALTEFFESSPASSLTKRHTLTNSTTIKLPLVVATDDKSWKVETKGEVRTMTVHDAIKAFPANDRWQVIVLCAWMPMGDDWTQTFREHKVDEYILIGECDDGQCGDNWKTWGNQHFAESLVENNDSSDDFKALEKSSRLYEDDGYRRKGMSVLSSFQFSRFDCSASKAGRTVSFRRRR